jgi:cell filamentation protein
VVSATTQLKLLALDGKKRLADMLDYSGIIALGKTVDYSYYYEEH